MTRSAIRAAGAVLLLAAAGLAAAHPLAPAALLAGMAAQAALVWYRPGAWLVSLPALLALLDLSPFTGWLLVGEADIFLLATIGVLCLRPPAQLPPLPRAAAWVLAAYAATTFGGVLLGLTEPAPVGGTANILLSPWNGVRQAKALAYALALAPFLWTRQRDRGDAPFLLAAGAALGLAGIAMQVALERMAFPGLFNFASDYRVSASFASMHVGGGHIGAWLAMSLPLLAGLAACRLRWGLPLLLLGGVGGTFALAMTFARTAYAAALAGIAVTAAGLVLASLRAPPPTTQVPARRAGRLGPLLALLALAGSAAGIVLAARGTAFMASRLADVSPDLAERARNWRDGLALRPPGPVSLAVGAGLGTYPRIAHAAAPDRVGPSNFALSAAGDTPALLLSSRGPFYFGQKIPAVPGQALRIALRLRAPGPPVPVSFGLCEKWLLYSEACAVATHRTVAAGMWETVSLSMTVPGVARAVPRPVEFWINAPRGSTVEIAGVRIADAAGQDLARNGTFRDGTAHWFFTDDGHGSWRIFNQYFMTLFEGGLLGTGTLLALFAAGLSAAWAGLRGGGPVFPPLVTPSASPSASPWAAGAGAAAVAGAMAAFAVSCLFDAQLEAPRVAWLFYLAVLAALSLAPAATAR